MTYFADLSFRFIHKCTRTHGALKNHYLIMTNLIENHNCFQTKTAQKPYPQGSGTEMGNTGESFNSSRAERDLVAESVLFAGIG